MSNGEALGRMRYLANGILKFIRDGRGNSYQVKKAIKELGKLYKSHPDVYIQFMKTG